MATLLTLKEIRSMQVPDLRREIAEHHLVLRKMRLDVDARAEKDTAKLRRVRKAIAQMETIVAEKSNSSTVSAPKNS